LNSTFFFQLNLIDDIAQYYAGIGLASLGKKGKRQAILVPSTIYSIARALS